MQYKLEIKNLYKAFGDLQALKNVSIQLDRGKLLAVLGPSGCGKTTVLRSIARFETPDQATIKIGGPLRLGPNTRARPERRRMGYVPQGGVLFPHLSAQQAAAVGASKSQREATRIDEILELGGMAGLGNRMPHERSGG